MEQVKMDKYANEYLMKIKAAETDEQLLDIIDDIYEDGVEDSAPAVDE